MATPAQLKQELINAVAKVRVNNQGAPLDIKFSDGKVRTIYSDGSFGGQEIPGVSFFDSALQKAFNDAEKKITPTARPTAAPAAPAPASSSKPVYGEAQGWMTAPGVEGNTARVFSNVDPRNGMPILNQAALDNVLKKYNSNTLNKDQYRDNYNAFGWNVKSDASSVAKGPAVFGINKATSFGLGGSGVSYTGDMNAVAKKLGINPGNYSTQEALYKAIEEKTQNLYLVSNSVDGGNKHAAILFVADGQGNLVAAGDPNTKKPAVNYYNATRNVTGESWLASLGPIPAIALSVIAPQLGLSAIQAAAIQGAVQIASGASVQDAIKYAAASVAASQVPSVLKEMGVQVNNAQIQNVLSSAASEATKAALTGQDVTKAALGAAVISGGVEATKSALSQGPQQAGEARLKVPTQPTYQLGGDIAQVPQQTGVTSRVPTGGGEGLVVDPSILYSSRFAPTQLVRGTGFGGLQPAYQSAESLITPAGLQQYTTPYTQRKDFTPAPLSRSEEQLLGEALGLGFEKLYGTDTGGGGGGGGAQTTYAATDTQRPTALPVGQYTPGSQALAQALRIGDVGAPIFGTDKDSGRKAGWNVESLRYMGDVGEA